MVILPERRANGGRNACSKDFKVDFVFPVATVKTIFDMGYFGAYVSNVSSFKFCGPRDGQLDCMQTCKNANFFMLYETIRALDTRGYDLVMHLILKLLLHGC